MSTGKYRKLEETIVKKRHHERALWSRTEENSKNIHLTIHFPMTERVSKRASEQTSKCSVANEQREQYGAREQLSSAERTSEWTSEWPSTCVPYFGCSEPK